ncbi:MAG: sugar transferase [Methylothermaceae bacteria B42]|nr:MAG: sugar transferase [Methylothermaceae bacteria B42]HHJ39397.1 TIGR03087 family PEP-CTERM/XrtA system glycosyltransferase [Methylothermaceae bacterium]
MANLLFLVHRIPYPPNKGDKIRSFHWLKHLAGKHRIFLGAFVDDPEDWRFKDKINDYCEDSCLLPLSPKTGKIKSLKGLFQGQPLSLPYYFDNRMKQWTKQLLGSGRIDRIFVYSSAMAQYVDSTVRARTVIDFVDVDSDKWRQYAKSKPFWSAWVYRREARLLLDYDRRVAQAFDLSLFVSQAEASLFKSCVPEAADKIDYVENGVDLEYFQGGREFVSPYHPGEEVFVFTGAMDYWANEDAVRWFANEVFRKILRRHVEARFYIVGARPTEAVKALARKEGVVVTGAVKDIRPYLAHARMAVAPLRIARGIQNKVLEALAMAKPVLASTMAADGLEINTNLDLAIVSQPEEMAQVAIQALQDRSFMPRISEKNRKFVEERYSWASHLQRLDNFLEMP